MKWIKIPWDNIEIIGLCLYFFGVGLGFSSIINEYVNTKFILGSATLLAVIAMCFMLYGSKKAFDNFKEEKENERI